MDTLELWAKNEKNFESILKRPADAFAEHELTSAIKGIAEFYAETAVPILLAAEAIHKVLTTHAEYADLSTELGQEEALTAEFVDPLSLATAGLGGVDAGELDQRFLDTIAGKDGMLRRWGLESAKLRQARQLENMRLRIVKVSYCKLREKCGPGDSTPGVEPFVYLDFRAGAPSSIQGGGKAHFSDTFVTAKHRQEPRLRSAKGLGQASADVVGVIDAQEEEEEESGPDVDGVSLGPGAEAIHRQLRPDRACAWERTEQRRRSRR